ncbi:MAG: asparaginase [Acidobacteriota bacterium]
MPVAPLPLLARVLRGGETESAHRGSVAVVDEDGRLLAECGEPGGPVFLRSAAKPIQAIPLLAAGGERAFGLGDDEIALLCASHGGEPRHVRTAARMLARGGFLVSDLACGAHLPMHEPSARALIARSEKPTPLHNNCSGKHAGLLLACRLLGFAPRRYEDPGHPLEQTILGLVSDYTGAPRASIGIAIDGCSLPVFSLPLTGLAAAYAQLGSERRAGESASGRAVRRRLWRAMCASPGMVAGRARFTTDFLEAGRGAWIGKEGAEGVYAIGLRPAGPRSKAVGIAFKIEDGSSRARDAVALEILDQLGRLKGDPARRLVPHRRPVIRSVRGQEVGEVRADLTLRRHAR